MLWNTRYNPFVGKIRRAKGKSDTEFYHCWRNHQSLSSGAPCAPHKPWNSSAGSVWSTPNAERTSWRSTGRGSEFPRHTCVSSGCAFHNQGDGQWSNLTIFLDNFFSIFPVKNWQFVRKKNHFSFLIHSSYTIFHLISGSQPLQPKNHSISFFF